jgi:hypothetical protein
LFSIITGITLYFVIKKYIGIKEALITTTLWAFSPLIVNLDRVFWNPNLILLATVLIFVPLLKVTADKYSYALLFIGAFLSYQAHFSGFLLVALGIFFILYLRRSWKLIIPIIIGLLISLIPTALFDIRHEFLNFNGLLALFSSKGETNFLPITKDFFKNIYITH